MRKTTLGVIVGTRGFFPGHLCETGRKEILRVLAEEGIDAIILDPDATPIHGAVETLQQAEKCAELFKAHRAEIDGILVTLPNFGDARRADCPGAGSCLPRRRGHDDDRQPAGQLLREDVLV